MAEWTNAAALKAAGRKARGFESLPFRRNWIVYQVKFSWISVRVHYPALSDGFVEPLTTAMIAITSLNRRRIGIDRTLRVWLEDEFCPSRATHPTADWISGGLTATTTPRQRNEAVSGLTLAPKLESSRSRHGTPNARNLARVQCVPTVVMLHGLPVPRRVMAYMFCAALLAPSTPVCRSEGGHVVGS